MEKISNKYSINLDIFGLDALPTFAFKHEDNLKFKTLITQEMLKKGFLAGNSCYVCIEHNDEIIDAYLSNLDEIFNVISKCIDNPQLIDEKLETEVCTSGFKRLN